jgi:hypothetical protein
MLPPKTPLANAYYRLLSRIWKRGPAQVQTLFKELDFSRTLGTRLLEQMTQEGIAGIDPDSGNLRILDSYGTVLGLHMGTKTVTAALVSFTGELLLTKDFPYPDRDAPLPQAILGSVALMEPFIRPPAAPPLRGVAISLPGIVDPYKLILRESIPLKLFEPLSLKDSLGRALGRPLTAENDANCCCWGEAVLHRRQNLGNFLYILAEQRPHAVGDLKPVQNYAVGFGLYLNGSVYHGTRFSAGEFQSIFKEERPTRTQFAIPDELMNRSYDDPKVEEAIAHELSRHAALLVNTLNLDRVYMSWPRPDRVSRIIEILRGEIQRNWSYHHPVACSVELPTMGLFAPAYGAAGLHLESLFQTADGPAPYFPGKN